MKRLKATLITASFVYILGIVGLLSMSNDYGTLLTFFGKSLFDWLDYLTASIALPVSGFVTAIFLGYFVDKNILKTKFTSHSSLLVFNVWYVLIKYIVPIAIALLFLNKLEVI